MSQSLRKNNSGLVGLVICALLLCLITSFLVMPHSLLGNNIDREVQSAYLWLRADDLQYSKQLLDALLPQVVDHLDELARANAKPTHNVQALIKMQDWYGTRMDFLKDLIFIWLVRLGIAVRWGLIFLPLLLGCSVLGYLQRQLNKSRFSFTSPFVLTLATNVCSFLAVACLVALLLPWFVHPWIIPSVIALFCLSVGLAVSKLQKNI